MPAYVRSNNLRHALTKGFGERRWDYLYHWAYGIAAKLTYRLKRRRGPLESGQASALGHMRTHGFVVVDDRWGKRAAFEKLAAIFSDFDRFCETHSRGYRPLKYVRMAGYTGIQAELTNQLHADSISDERLGLIRDALDGSGIGDVIREFLQSDYGVCNARIWRFFPITEASDSRIHPHSDGFPTNMIKLMVFPRRLSADSGGTELYVSLGDKRVFFELTGYDAMILFDPTNVVHGAPAPTGGYRDTIELTIMPQLRSVPQVVSAGFQAGYPLVPWLAWTRPAGWIIAK